MLIDDKKSSLAWNAVAAVEHVGKQVLTWISSIGAFCQFALEAFNQIFKKPFRRAQIFQHLEFVGNQSVSIILLTGFFTGAVFGLQIGGIFELFKAEGLMGGATGKALTRELAPLMTAFLLAGRAGSAMTAELATMRVNEQIDAMEAMAVDPVHYLVAPRLIASLLIMPLLCGIFIFVGVIGAFMAGLMLFEIDQGVFLEKLVWLVDPKDIAAGLQKMVVFSAIIAIISCRYGLYAGGGAKGVGIATTDAVVSTLLTILCFDFVISFIQIVW